MINPLRLPNARKRFPYVVAATFLLGSCDKEGDPPLSPEPMMDGGPGQMAPATFRLVEASVDDIHGALTRGESTCEAITKLYFARIKAYSGQCVKYDKNGDGVSPDYDFAMPSGKGIYLGVVQPIESAGKVNAIQNVNLRPANYAALGFAPPHDPGPRSETDLIDANPALPDALESAQALDREYATTRVLKPLQCVPIVIKDQMDTADLRTTDGSLTQFVNDRPPTDGTLVKKLREAGAIIIAKANMDEYAGGTHRSSYGGHVCNPYATNRDSGSSSTGSAAAVAVNLAVCGIAEESLGSIREPGKKSGLVAMAPTRGLVSRSGTWAANLLRERFGPICRNVSDLAKVLDAIKGYDAADPITATQVGMIGEEPLAKHAYAKSMAGKRLGIVREFMPRLTVNDEDSIRVFNEEVIPTLRKAGAELVESFNARDIEKGWSVDDPSIPNIDLQSIVAQMIPAWEPSFANASTLPIPNTTTALLPNNLRTTLGAAPALFPEGTDMIRKSVEIAVGSTPFPAEISLRKLNETPTGSFHEGRYGLDTMLAKRGDARVRSVLDLSIDFDDLDKDGDATEHLTFARIGDDVMGSVVLRNRPGVEPAVGVPAMPSGLTLDTQGQAGHVFRQQAIREIVARIMAEYKLDALVYPYETIPAKIMTGTADSVAWLSYDGRPNRGYNGFTDVSGLPDIGVPAGFTRVVYDRTTRGMPTEELALDPPSIRREVMLPFSVQFLGRMWSERTLLELASAYEAARGPRTPPPGFGPLEGEP